MSGFGLRVSSTGRKSWIVGVRVLKGGKRVFTRIVLGSYPGMSLAEAREKAREAKTLALEDKDPRAPRQKRRAVAVEQSRNTFGSLVDEFLTKYVKRKELRATTVRDYIQTLRGKDVAPWKERPVASITKRDVLDALAGILDRGAPIEANHFLARLRRFFGWCAEREIIETVPTDRLKDAVGRTQGARRPGTDLGDDGESNEERPAPRRTAVEAGRGDPEGDTRDRAVPVRLHDRREAPRVRVQQGEVPAGYGDRQAAGGRGPLRADARVRDPRPAPDRVHPDARGAVHSAPHRGGRAEPRVRSPVRGGRDVQPGPLPG
ncbi:MAG: integrase family protein [Candidatus Riflebacteria bacterium]|nr:integrase family protein [Candidatus Riflebacteria bacterium]